MSTSLPIPSLFPEPEPEPRAVVDIGVGPTLEWERPMDLPSPVAEYTAKQQADAVQVTEHYLASVREPWRAEVEGATAAHHAVLRDPEATPRERKVAQEQLNANVEALITRRLERLRAAVAKAETELADPPPDDAADLLKVDELLSQLRVLTPRYAAPILRRALIANPLRTGKLGFVRTMLPLLRSLAERDPSYGDDFAVARTIMDAEVVLMDKRWRARRRLAIEASGLGFKLRQLGADLREHGLDDPALMTGTGWYRDIGVAP